MTQELEQKNLRNSHVVKIAQMNANENISAFRPSGTKSNANSSMIYETMSINPSYAGIQDWQLNVYCDKHHKMKFQCKRVDAMAFRKQDPDIHCNLCDDEIDVALGYFTCPLCNENHCKECAVDRDKMETEIAENPMFVATPAQDVMKDSWVGKQLN